MFNFKTQPHPEFQKRFDDFKESRLPTDRDLVTEVRDLLISAGLTESVVAYFDTNHRVQQALDKRPEGQRYLLNQYWHIQLIMPGIDTTDERFCLVPNGTLDEWLNLFQSRILPFCIQHRLPRPIT